MYAVKQILSVVPLIFLDNVYDQLKLFPRLFQWSHLEQNNFTIEEYIANKKAELNYEPIKNKVMKIQAQYNQLLIECLRNKSSI